MCYRKRLVHSKVTTETQCSLFEQFASSIFLSMPTWTSGVNAGQLRSIVTNDSWASRVLERQQKVEKCQRFAVEVYIIFFEQASIKAWLKGLWLKQAVGCELWAVSWNQKQISQKNINHFLKTYRVVFLKDVKEIDERARKHLVQGKQQKRREINM